MRVPAERFTIAALLAVALAAVAGAATGPASFPWGSALVAAVGLAAAGGALFWLAPRPGRAADRVVAWLLGGVGALVVGLGSLADYELWSTDSRLWTAGCSVVACLVVGLAGLRGGWVGGLRASAVASLGSTSALLLLLRANLGVPLQAAVFQASGILDSYETGGSGEFSTWVTDAHLYSVLPRTIAALAVGAALGAGVSWSASSVRRWFRKAPRAGS